jgi:diguanylate cyclase (GGDEF)-like protein
VPLRRALMALSAPGGMAALAWWVARSETASPLRHASWAPELPYLVLGLVALVAFCFHRLNLVYVTGVLAGSCAVVEFVLPEAPRLLPLLVTLLPWNLLLFMTDNPPSLRTASGWLRPGLMALQAAVLVGLARPALWIEYSGGFEAPPADLALALGRSCLPAGWPVVSPAHLSWGLAGVVALLRLSARPDPFRAATLVSLLAVTGGFLDRDLPGATSWYFCGAGLALGTALVQHSYNLAYRDELTGLPGRRALTEAMGRLRGRYVLAMLDVDHFKNFNDTYGHDVGDQVLRLVASRVRRASGSGQPFRYGGEEFTLLFPGKNLEDVVETLEEVRLAVEETPMTLRGPDRPRQKLASRGKRSREGRQKVTLTISIGAASPNAAARTPDQVLKNADQALYRAKQQGRNRVCVAD